MTQQSLNFDRTLTGLTPVQRFVVETIQREATAAKPMRNQELRLRIAGAFPNENPSERKVKSLVRELRKDHGCQILAKRDKPAGYYWCDSIEQMKAFIAVFSSQAKDEFHTLHKIVRKHYPALAGQLSLVFEELMKEAA
jgi:hypothetical protein